MNKLEKFWDKASKGFADQDQNIQLKKNKDFITTLKYLNRNDTVLDYGCGSGIVSNAIADKVKEIHAIDISSKMIEIAKSKAHERNIKNIYYTQANIFDERYKNKSFNIILAFRILHMLENPKAVLHRISELLQPEGVFISVTTCMGSLKVLLCVPAFLLKKMGILPVHINWFKLEELQRIMTGQGFQIIEYEKMDDPIAAYCIVARKEGITKENLFIK